MSFFFLFSAIHYNSSSRGLAVATSEQIALLQLKNKLVRKIALTISGVGHDFMTFNLVIITVEPAGKASFVYRCMGQYNGK